MLDPEIHKAIIGLVICYTLTAAFVFTVVTTALSTLGIIKFKPPSLQKLLLPIIIVEVASGGVAYFLGFLKSSPKAVVTEIVKPYVATATILRTQNELLADKISEAAQSVAALKSEKAALNSQLVTLNQNSVPTSHVVALKTEIDRLQADVRDKESVISSLQDLGSRPAGLDR